MVLKKGNRKHFSSLKACFDVVVSKRLTKSRNVWLYNYCLSKFFYLVYETGNGPSCFTLVESEMLSCAGAIWSRWNWQDDGDVRNIRSIETKIWRPFRDLFNFFSLRTKTNYFGLTCEVSRKETLNSLHIRIQSQFVYVLCSSSSGGGKLQNSITQHWQIDVLFPQLLFSLFSTR